MSKYAVKVKVGEDDWLYVSEGLLDTTLRVVLFDTQEMAQEFANLFEQHSAEVVEYESGNLD